jgi:CBS-domain-containing membrane protein
MDETQTNIEAHEEMPQQANGFETILKYWPIILSVGAFIYGYADLKEKNYRLWLQFDEHKKLHVTENAEKKALVISVSDIKKLLIEMDKKIDIDREKIPLIYATKQEVVMKAEINKQHLLKK